MTQPFDTPGFRRALGQFPTGVTVITCRGPEGEPWGITANSFSSVSLDPPLILWSVDRNAGSAEAFCAATSFAVCVLDKSQVDIANRFAMRGAEKFDGIELPDGLDSVPLIPGAIATFECLTEALVDGGDHVVIIGRVRGFSVAPGEPMVFARGEFSALAERTPA